MDKNLHEKLKKEAIARMERLKLDSAVIAKFVDDDIINCTSNVYLPPLSWEWVIQLIEDFQESHNSLVFYAILSDTNYGKMLSLLFVSSNEDEWHDEKAALYRDFPYAYVYNLTYPQNSEYGTIKIENNAGQITRVK